jgi:hypothetical protein
MNNDVVFNICDSRNVYEPCPKCKATQGMGLTSRANRLFVRCDCGHEGPGVQTPRLEQYATWPVSSQGRDRLAFEGWNEASRSALPESPASQSGRTE